jgi:aminodeoxyfutalosine deaminase
MIVRARVLVTMQGPPVENGAVAISEDRIVDVGTFPEIRSRNAGQEVVDLGEQALLPGLINAHCHLDYTCLRGKIPPPQSFTAWVRAINAAKTGLSPEDYVASINEGSEEAKQFGTTTIANLTGFPELIAEVRAPVRTWWFAELIDVRDPARAKEVVDHAIELLKGPGNWGLAPHALFTASKNLFRRCGDAAREESVLLTTHLAESHEEMSMFRDAAGPLYEFLKEIGRDMTDCGHATPVEEFFGRLASFAGLRRAKGEAFLPEQWIVAHLNEIQERDFDLLARRGPNLHVAHCPRSHKYFGHSRFPFERLHRLGFNICLGTDSLASNDDLSLFAEMRAFQGEFPNVAPEDILKMATTNPARALRYENAVGKIGPGFLADLIAVPYNVARERGRLFEEILGFSRPINWMTIAGQLL